MSDRLDKGSVRRNKVSDTGEGYGTIEFFKKGRKEYLEKRGKREERGGSRREGVKDEEKVMVLFGRIRGRGKGRLVTRKVFGGNKSLPRLNPRKKRGGPCLGGLSQ